MTYTGMSPLRLLLTAMPYEFNPFTVVDGETDRAFMYRQAKRALEVNDGRGLSYINADEHARIVAVWSKGEARPAILTFSTRAWAEIEKAEERIAAKDRSRKT